MNGASASPIDIAGSRQNSSSPRSQQSNLTSQLQGPSIDIRQDETMSASIPFTEPQDRKESVGMLSTTPYGARAIPMRGPSRRESNYGLSGSLANGMSWGGISMGSFIKDDILMAGTSPYGFQSPSFHSSSYLPKMEANYMRDYRCCDIKLDSMHELLQHYEEAHAAMPQQTMGRTPLDKQFPSRASNATTTAQSVQQQARQQIDMQQAFQNNGIHPFHNQQTTDTFDLDDMEMDEGTPAPQVQQPQGPNFQPQPQFGRQQPRSPLNTNLANAFQGQALRSATPTTPHASQQAFNPTVSSVNTPTLSTQTTATNQITSPDSSVPGTPSEIDSNIASQFGDGNNIDYSQLMQGNFDFNNLNLNNNGGSGTIDDPAKRLLSKQGFGGGKASPNPAFANSQTNTSELAKRVREAQLLNGLAGAGGFVGEEIKPFKCPVIGCEKAYKNQNGLKYHKQHGHQNQTLKENADGTFSIVNPVTNVPYPGTLGMEKEKPYRCEVCGKRYKNLNGLKYHRQHSPPCNPELKFNPAASPGAQSNVQGMNVNVAGAGMVQNGITGM
ncbi:hypothetical protein K431DRAFT_235729 [Polychaeton citri CBS 116435]|uniref:C2H2-type domain-containing protein n=1 Tax=Polychaeton citri CBS 116435 TaxID=1314669 RepID=A0A9P4PWK8_9PEZI|nr:hypothetical protein K431DRAFT_235729 [Polychaeton citri CBS 116435]